MFGRVDSDLPGSTAGRLGLWAKRFWLERSVSSSGSTRKALGSAGRVGWAWVASPPPLAEHWSGPFGESWKVMESPARESLQLASDLYNYRFPRESLVMRSSKNMSFRTLDVTSGRSVSGSAFAEAILVPHDREAQGVKAPQGRPEMDETSRSVSCHEETPWKVSTWNLKSVHFALEEHSLSKVHFQVPG